MMLVARRIGYDCVVLYVCVRMFGLHVNTRVSVRVKRSVSEWLKYG